MEFHKDQISRIYNKRHQDELDYQDKTPDIASSTYVKIWVMAMDMM
jgi:hypothetical protein